MTSIQSDRCSLVADIGGTNTRVAMLRNGVLDVGSVQRFVNAENPDFDTIAQSYLNGTCDTLDDMVIAIAGPVEDRRGQLTNLHWTLDEEALAKTHSARRAHVINDLVAHGYGLSTVPASEIHTIRKGNPAPDDATRLMVGIGTGFNAATVLAPQGKTGPVRFLPSESGHIGLPTPTDRLHRLSERLARNLGPDGFVTVEDILSGRGLRHCDGLHPDYAPLDKLRDTHDIFAAAREGEDRARDAIRLTVEVLGVVSGDHALSYLPFGGLFLVGGMAQALRPYFQGFGFEAAFRAKGRFAQFMDRFPVYVVDSDTAALNGCAAYLRGSMG